MKLDNIEGFLQAFFGEGNDIRYQAVVERRLHHDAQQALELWLEDLHRGRTHPILLPRAKQGELSWYALAQTEQQAEALREELTAFIGPSYSDLGAQPGLLDMSEPIDRLVHQAAYGHAAKFYVWPDGDVEQRQRVRVALEILRDVWHRRPERTREVARPTGRLLRDFEFALQLQDEEAAARLLEELQAGGRLDAANLQFLRIRLLAAFRRWDELLDDPNLPTVLRMRRPLGVTRDLVRAVFHRELAGYETDSDVDGAIIHFRERLLPAYEPLYRSRAGSLTRESAVSFMLLAAATTPPRAELRDDLLEEANAHGLVTTFLEEVAARVSGGSRAAPLPTLEEAQQVLAQQGGLDEALALTVQAEPSVSRAQFLLTLALELGTIDAAGVAFDAVRTLDEAQRGFLAWKLYASAWSQITGLLGGDAAPSDWADWVRRLNDRGAWPEAVEIAHRAADEWDPRDYERDPGLVEALHEELTRDRDENAQAVLVDSLPLLTGFFLPPTGPSSRFRGIYEHLLDLLFLQDRYSDQELDITLDLVDAILRIGATANDYHLLTGELHSVWQTVRSIAKLDWALDVLQLLAWAPCPDESRRAWLFSIIAADFARWRHRLPRYRHVLLREVARDMGIEESVQLPEDVPETTTGVSSIGGLELLNGMSVALYTLTEQVARRVATVIRDAAPDCTVSTSADHVGTDRLRQLSEHADIFVVAPRSAKHAATEFIAQHRPKAKPILWSSGKGVTSMLRAVEGHLNQEPRYGGRSEAVRASD
jgi:hypothetical protein